MAKKSKTPPDISALREATKIFEKQKDRGTALIAAAWVDDALETYLRASLRQDEGMLGEMFQPDGPLGTFSSRIKLAFLLGLIGPIVREELDIIRGIRNDFAHTRQDLRFTSQSVKDRCKQLQGAQAIETGTGNPIKSARDRFTISAFLVADYLLNRAESAKPPEEELDLYWAMIHRYVKSMSISNMLEAIKKRQSEEQRKAEQAESLQ